MLRDLVWLEKEEKEAWYGCEVELPSWGVDQVGTLLQSGLGPAGLWGPLLPTRPKTVGPRVREREKGQESSAERRLAGPGRTRKGRTWGVGPV